MNEPSEKRSVFAVWRWPWWAIALAMLLMVPSAYFSTYLALLRGAGGIPIFTSAESGYVAEALKRPLYRLESMPSWQHRLEVALEPAHQLDRRLRPQYWADDPVPLTALSK
jgi:hypothetical protein